METKVYSVENKIGYSQVDHEGIMKGSSLIQILEESAIEHCSAIGRNIFSLLKEGFGWVLRSGMVEFIKYPRYGEKVLIETWLSKWTAFQGVREFVLMNGKREIYAKATSLWAFIDIFKRHPSPVPKSFKDKWQFDEKRAVDTSFIKQPCTMPFGYTQEPVDIRRNDIDSNNHVNNVTYLEWIQDAVPVSFSGDRKMKSMKGTFLQEARDSDKILVQVGVENDNELVHNVVRIQDGVVLATGCSEWG